MEVNIIVKVIERIIYKWLHLIIDGDGCLSNRQFSFRTARSTFDTTKVVFELARKAFDEGKFCALVTCDIKNAFNSAEWNGIIEALMVAYLTDLNKFLSSTKP